MGGFFGTISRVPCINDLFYGTDYCSHLGTRRAGMATFSKEKGFLRSIHSLESNYFRSKFEPELKKFEGCAGVGIVSDTDAQPQLMNSHLGRFAIVTVAKVNNLESLADKLLNEGMTLSEFSSGKINPTELIALLICRGKNFVEGIENVFRNVKGSCSLLILTEDGIIAARDTWGRTPIVLGCKKDADGNTIAMCAGSETTSFPNLDFEIERDLGPGEIVKITSEGYEQLRKPNKQMQICSFLWVYYGFPTSCYEGRNCEEVRFATGRAMGEKDDTPVDCAAGIPDSGVGMALGYAAGHKVPYQRAISKYTPTWPRSFTPREQSQREFIAKMKLIPNKAVLKGKSIVFCDDSIVRGTQLRDNTVALHEGGAKGVHMRIACPPLIYGCQFIGFTSSKSDLELITRRIIGELEGDPNKNLEAYCKTDSPEYKRLVSEIATRLNLDSLRFSTIEDLVAAIGLPKECICTHCFDGSSFHTLESDNLD